jgi:hypothetical protein
MSNVGEKSKDGGGGGVHRNRERLAQYYGGENTTDPSTTSATATPASSSVTRYICTLLFFRENSSCISGSYLFALFLLFRFWVGIPKHNFTFQNSIQLSNVFSVLYFVTTPKHIR